MAAFIPYPKGLVGSEYLTYQQLRCRGFLSPNAVKDQLQFVDALGNFGLAGLRPSIDFDHDMQRLSFYPKTPEAFQKMTDIALDKDYVIHQ